MINALKRIGKIILKGLLNREIKTPGLTFGQLGQEDHFIMYIYEQNYAFKGTSEMQVNLAILKGCKKIDYNWCVGFKVKQGKYVTVTVL